MKVLSALNGSSEGAATRRPDADSKHLQKVTSSRNYPARDHYRGEEARQYEEVRLATASKRRKWNAEFLVLNRVLTTLPENSSLLDMPCGTGRFFPLLSRLGIHWVGADISRDMLKQIPTGLTGSAHGKALVVCEAEHLPFGDSTFDYTLCVRFFNLIPLHTTRSVLSELARISRRGVIIQIRLRGGRILFDSLLRWLRIWWPARLRELFHLGSRDHPGGSTIRRTFSPPLFLNFREAAEESGLRIVRTLPVGGLRSYLQPDRLKLCVLERPGHEDR